MFVDSISRRMRGVSIVPTTMAPEKVVAVAETLVTEPLTPVTRPKSTARSVAARMTLGESLSSTIMVGDEDPSARRREPSPSSKDTMGLCPRPRASAGSTSRYFVACSRMLGPLCKVSVRGRTSQCGPACDYVYLMLVFHLCSLLGEHYSLAPDQLSAPLSSADAEFPRCPTG